MKDKRVVYGIPGMQNILVDRGVTYNASGLTMDLYRPRETNAAPSPAVLIALGYPDVGVATPFGCQFREMGTMVSWAQLFAASGMVGVLYETRQPMDDANAVLTRLQENGPAMGIDERRIAVWACSGNVPVALSLLFNGRVRCGVLCYGFMLDVAKAAAEYRFANPTEGRRVEDIPSDTALFVARAGRDQFASLNESLDAFVAEALRCNLPLTLVNHATGPHGFDFADDTSATRYIIQAILAFLHANLLS